MSLQARRALVEGGRLIFQDDSQPRDLLNISITQTELIALLSELVSKGHIIEVTAVCSDHHPDACLGRHSHENGFDADVWPLASSTPGDYLDAGDPRFAQFLRDAAASSWLYQIGLAGSAYTDANMAAAGPTAFHDDGADHIHLGANG